MQWSDYEALYIQLKQDGTTTRVAALEGSEHMFVTPAMVARWDGWIQCSSLEGCGEDAVFLLGGNHYCLNHTIKIVMEFEHDQRLRERVEAAHARLLAAYDGDDYAEFELAMQEVELAEAALAEES